MTLRHVFYIGLIGLAIYAWKDWFVSLCGLILMMAVIRYENMPSAMYGIQGLNPWNFLFIVTFLAWLFNRRREGLTSDMPRHINILLLMYLGVILVGWLRAAIDRSYIEDYPFISLVSEELIDTVKWVIPGLMLFDGCRTRRRVVMVIVSVLLMYFLIAEQVIIRMPVFAATHSISNVRRTSICMRIGYTSCDISTFLAGTFWGILAVIPLIHQKKFKVLLLPFAGIVILAQALTGGRAGYVAWIAIGSTLCMLKWRKYLLLAPIVMILLPVVFPCTVERMSIGFGETDVAGQSFTDEEKVTSDRLLIWPYIIDKIAESILIGHGRRAMNRTGIVKSLEAKYPGIGASQPHNMYLETLLDNGIIGSIPIFLFWGMTVIYSGRLFRSDNRLCSAVGGVALSMTIAQLVAGLGSQHFYPEESTLGTWAAIFLSIRTYLEQKQMQVSMVTSESHLNEQSSTEHLVFNSVYTYRT